MLGDTLISCYFSRKKLKYSTITGHWLIAKKLISNKEIIDSDQAFLYLSISDYRGEKLYVTADKRGEKGGCKRPLCWTLLGLVVAAIVALIVLAASNYVLLIQLLSTSKRSLNNLIINVENIYTIDFRHALKKEKIFITV